MVQTILIFAVFSGVVADTVFVVAVVVATIVRTFIALMNLKEKIRCQGEMPSKD